MRFLSLAEVLRLHAAIIEATGGSPGVRDLGQFESATAQPHATFDGNDVYPELVDKAAALGFSLIQGHAFVDGNKRVGHAAMEVFLLLNGFELEAAVDEQEATIIAVASGSMSQTELATWLRGRLVSSSD